jgi:hypothetical protein
LRGKRFRKRSDGQSKDPRRNVVAALSFRAPIQPNRFHAWLV